MINLKGQVFGRLKVLEFSHRINSKGTFWKCKCDCGNFVNTTSNRLRRGQTASCGCLAKERTALALRLDIIGNKFGKLTVTNLSHIKNSRTYWNCSCDCGNFTISIGSNLMKGQTASCGCLHYKYKNRPEDRVFNIVYSHYKCEAKRSKREFNLSYEQFKQIIKSNCTYCGSAPYNYSAKNNTDIKYGSVDRIDSKKDYVLDNVRSSCSKCNIMKLDHTEDEFKEQINKIYNYWSGKK